MSKKELEKAVVRATEIREQRNALRKEANDLRKKLGTEEGMIRSFLDSGERLPKNSDYEASIVTEERGSVGLPYKKAMDTFKEGHPEYTHEIEEIIESIANEKVERLKYGKKEVT